MRSEQRGSGLFIAAVLGLVLGVGVLVGAFLISPAGESVDNFTGEASVEYGRRLIRETAALLGPGHEDPAKRYSGTNMDCASCHLETGTKAGTLSLLQATSRYPRFSGRDGKEGDLRDRINGCMTRSMNGREISRDSIEMIHRHPQYVGWVSMLVHLN